MSKAQRVGNVYFAQFGLQAGRGARGEGFEDSMADIRSAVDAIADVSRLISDDNRKLARLCNESSRRIAEVLSIIEAVALDSNLVALNAALEASREDRGRYDIALVASEVRALLSRSESATCGSKGLNWLPVRSGGGIRAGTWCVAAFGTPANERVTRW
jgi:hypothetical protein